MSVESEFWLIVTVLAVVVAIVQAAKLIAEWRER